MSRTTTSKFVRVKCKDCESEQAVFNKAAMAVKCNACGSTLVEPRGGLATLKAEIVSELE